MTDVDVHDLNYLTSSRRMKDIHAMRGRPNRGWMQSFARFFGGWLRSALRRPPSAAPVIDGVAAFAGSRNQLRPIMALQSGARELQITPFSLVSHIDLGVPRIPLHQAYAASLRAIPRILRDVRQSRGYEREAWRRNGQEYALTYGLVPFLQRWLDEASPKAVLVSNDHTMRPRAIVHAARTMGIPTIYVQHASITTRFPPLSFDVALLDGRHALDTYLACGDTTTTVFLTGSPIHDALAEAGARAAASDRIGLCLNELDEPPRASAWVTRIRTAFGPDALEVRTHPRDGRPWRQYLAHSGMAPTSIRSAAHESLEDFLARVGTVVAGESNVHLEAAVFGRPSVMVSRQEGTHDRYGFCEHGLVECVSPDALVSAIERAASERHHVARESALRRFSATAGSPWAGHSSQLASEVVRSVASAASPPSPFRASRKIGSATVWALSEESLST